MTRQRKTPSSYNRSTKPTNVSNEPPPINFQTINQEQADAVTCMKRHSIVFLTGPAGSAKTFVATAWGLKQMLYRDIRLRITRPAVQQGAEIGFLPGRAEEKVSPFMYPIYESIDKLIGDDDKAREVKRQVEILPLSLIRGRTIENSTLIVDEAQNLSWSEIVAIATRLGDGGQIIFCGDISQNDMQGGKSKLEDAAQVLDGGEADGFTIGWHQFTLEAIVRHPLVRVVIERMS